MVYALYGQLLEPQARATYTLHCTLDFRHWTLDTTRQNRLLYISNLLNPEPYNLKPCTAKSPAVYRQLSEGPPKWQNPKDQQDPWAKETKPSTDYAHDNIPSCASSTESAEVCRKVEERTGHSLVFSDRFISLCIGGGFRSGLQRGPGIPWINLKSIDSVFAASDLAV